MKIDSMRTRLANVEATAKAAAPEACRGCVNLGVTRAETGSLVLTCALAGSRTDMDRRQTLERGDVVLATTGWLNEVIFGNTSGQLVNTRQIRFQAAMETAADDCPIISRIIEELPGQMLGTAIDLTPPAPVLPA
jgi:hypothetical protein